jgi:hypothetical protein
MKRSLGVSVALCAGLLAMPAIADDTRYQDFPVGSRAATLGGAFVAISDEATGLTYNPAGICDTKDINVSASASLYGVERQSKGTSPGVITGGDFSVATLASLNVIPGEAGSTKAFGAKSEQGSQFAYGFDVTVPSFRSYGTDSSTSTTTLHTRVVDRSFDAAAGFAMRLDSRWSVGVAGHFNLRLFSDTEDALVTNNAADPTLGVYHAEATFTNASISLTLGGKYRDDNGWTYGASVATPGLRVYSSGSVQEQDVTTNPNAAAPLPHTTVNIISTTDVQSATGVPLAVRLGAAKAVAKSFTASGQLTLDLPTSYSRFELDPTVAQRLQLQSSVERHAVLNLNVGGEYMFADNNWVGVGLFTDFSTAPGLQYNANNTLVANTSHLDNVSLYGGTVSVSFLGEHSVSRFGMTLSYGKGEEAVPVDPTGISDPNGFTRSEVSQLFLYFFLAGSFRY